MKSLGSLLIIFGLFLFFQSIVYPTKAEAPTKLSNSETSLFSGSSLLQGDPSLRKTSQNSGQSSGTMEVELEEAEEPHAAAPTIPPNPNLNLDALDALCKNWAIEVTYPASWQKK